MGGKVVLITDIDVCIAYKEYMDMLLEGSLPSPKFYAQSILSSKFEVPEHVVLSACQRAAANGFIDYCLSIQCGCLTYKGYKLLSDLEARQKEKREDYQNGIG